MIAYEPAWPRLHRQRKLPHRIIDLASGEPVIGDGVGQLVVTRLDLEYPLLRLVTEWQGHWLAGASPCGRTNRRLRLV